MKGLLFTMLLFCYSNSFGHPMPNSILIMDIEHDVVFVELQIPINELQFVFSENITNNTDTLIERFYTELSDYFTEHINPVNQNGTPWDIKIVSFDLNESEQTEAGAYQELIVKLKLTPPHGSDIRKFDLYYDGVLHQVATHKILVIVRSDWAVNNIENNYSEIGVISLDIVSNTVLPLKVDLGKVDKLASIKSMFFLGIQHISEGTDHLLFILLLLLPSTLLVKGKKWSTSGSTKRSILRLIKITFAFTIGHSLTLLVGAFNWITFPQQPIEIFIAITILITAIHVIRPIFFGKEIIIASGFGLIHGLAFSTTLSGLQLESSEMLLNVLGFNIGIEVMQIFIITITIPWLIILSSNPIYKWIRIVGAVLSVIISISWIIERSIGDSNFITTWVEKSAVHSKWILVLLIILVVIIRIDNFRKSQTYSNQ